MEAETFLQDANHFLDLVAAQKRGSEAVDKDGSHRTALCRYQRTLCVEYTPEHDLRDDAAAVGVVEGCH